MKNIRVSIGAALLSLAALLLTFKFKTALGWSPDFIVPVLAATAFFLDLYALAALVLLTAWVLNWQVGLPPELWLVIAAPFVAWLGKKFLPSAPWFTLAAVIGASEIVLYVLAAPEVFWSNLGFIISNIIFAILLGLALMKLLEWGYEKR